MNSASPPKYKRGRILLALLPFWTPLIPPLGICCLKSYLQQHGFWVFTADANTEVEFREIYDRYFEILKRSVPEENRGNFFSIGQDVLHNHMMAHLNAGDEGKYLQLVAVLIERTFFCQPGKGVLLQLSEMVAEFYSRLEKYVVSLLERVGPAVLGLSVCSGTLAPSLFAFKLAKRLDPHIMTVMGGGIFCDQFAVGTPNFKILLEKTRDCIDHVVVGEGEILFLQLLAGQLPRDRRCYSLQEIAGKNLDVASLGIPDFNDLDLSHYPYLSHFTSRSCPHQCNFCSDTVMWGRYRKKSGRQVLEELTRLYEKWGHQLFMMSDLLLNPTVSELAKEFEKSEISLYWDGCLRAEEPVCSIKNTLRWRRGGFYKARIGAESGSPRVLELMKKRISVEQIKAAVSSLAHAGIQTTTYWVIGYPGETEDDFSQTLALIEELKDEIYEAECRPFYYYLSGQAHSSAWAKEKRSIPLYPEDAEEMLLFQTWLLDGVPSRQETYQRVGRFVRFCDRLGIANPYSIKDLYQADERWQKLHHNAVPPLLAFKNHGVYQDECKRVEGVQRLDQPQPEETGDFNF